MGIYFGTDGIRGFYGKDITPQIAYRIGNSLGRLCNKHKKIVIGRDTRTTGNLLLTAFACGVMSQGVNVVDVGIVTSPAIAFLAKEGLFDFGVMITASHNPANNNGIKIFDDKGFKLDDQTESEIESKLLYINEVDYKNVGQYSFKPALIKKYKEKVLSFFSDLRGQKIVIDTANGASFKIAKDLFCFLGSKLIILNNKHSGIDINDNCGALYPQNICQAVKTHGADMGFAFDGDADRIIACDENGNLLDGDDILYILSKGYPKEKFIVGTTMTNSGLEKALTKIGKKLIRADVGDKYVAQTMKDKNIKLGGETSGHIINLDFSTTGDGVLSALMIANIKKRESKPLSKICDFKHLPQVLINVEVDDKNSAMNCPILINEIAKIKKNLSSNGRILVRASGTENKIRIMCEHKDEKIATSCAGKIEKTLKSI